ncbi:MAG: hypothetical protein ICV69_06385 [Thermoleophilaceae bacterium]|nr:hypothetical protein [Thermoleophilaceae bacterium]
MALHYRTCPFREATCGLEMETDGPHVHVGVNSNVLADETVVEPVSGNAVPNGIPVEIARAPG